MREINMRWSCNDSSHHEHLSKEEAAQCAKAQMAPTEATLLKKLKRLAWDLNMAIVDEAMYDPGGVYQPGRGGLTVSLIRLEKARTRLIAMLEDIEEEGDRNPQRTGD